MPVTKEAVAKAKILPMHTETPVFANEKARIAWEVRHRVSKIAAELPTETRTLNAKAIRFYAVNKTRGVYAVLFSGTVIGTDQKGVFVVPDRTLTILEKLGIPYHGL